MNGVDVDTEPRKYSRRGPVPRAAEKKRTNAVSVRFNAEELAMLEQKCHEAGRMPQGKFLRLAALSSLPPAPIPSISCEALSVLANIAQQLQSYGQEDVSAQFQPDQVAALKALADLLHDVRCRLIGLPQTTSGVASES